MSITKSWKLREQLTAQFRAEAFNIINITQFAAPSTNPNNPGSFGVAQGTPNSNNPVVGEGGPRTGHGQVPSHDFEGREN